MIELFLIKLILCFKTHLIHIFGPLWYICEDDFKHNKQYQASVFRNREIYPEKIRYTSVSYTHLRAHETSLHLVCRLLLEKKGCVR